MAGPTGFEDLIPKAAGQGAPAAVPTGFEDLIPKPPSLLSRAADKIGEYAGDQAHVLATMGEGAYKGADQAYQELKGDFTKPLDFSTDNSVVGDILQPGAPVWRGLKVAGDAFNVPIQAVVGATAPYAAEPLGRAMNTMDPRYTHEEYAALTPEQQKETGTELLTNIANIPFAADGAGMLGHAEDFARARLPARAAPAEIAPNAQAVPPVPPAVEPTPTAPPTPRPATGGDALAAVQRADALEAQANAPETPPESRTSMLASANALRAQADTISPDGAPSHYPEFDPTSGAYHVRGPDGARVGPPTGYGRPEQAEAAADILNRPPLSEVSVVEPTLPTESPPDALPAPKIEAPPAAAADSENIVEPPDAPNLVEPIVPPAERQNTLLMKVPPLGAKDLVSWIRSKGGIKDTEGTIAALYRSMGKRPAPGIIANKTGRGIDIMAGEARDQGYFPEHPNETGAPDTITGDDLVSAIEDQLNGAPRYSQADLEQVQARAQAMAYNDQIKSLSGKHGVDYRNTSPDEFHGAVKTAEMQDLASRVGLDVKGKSAPEIADAVADHLSLEQHGEVARQMADAHEAAYADDVARRADDLGDAWEGEPSEYELSQPRTLEDIENEHAEQSHPESGAEPRGSSEGQAVSGQAPESVAGREGGNREGDIGRAGDGTAPGTVPGAPAEGANPPPLSRMQRGPGGMPALRAALLSGNVKRGAQAIIDRMRLQAGLDASHSARFPDAARAGVDHAEIREVESFIDFIGHHMFRDVGLRILKGSEGGTLGMYNAYNHVVSIFREAIANGELGRTAVHELWHSLERVLPRADYAAVTREFQRQQGKWLGKNEWARPFLQNGELSDTLTGARGRDWLAANRDDPKAMAAVKVLKDGAGKETGVAMRWTPENYRFKNREEYFAETMADKTFKDADIQDAKARSVFAHARDMFRRMGDGIARLFGRDQTGRIFEGFRNQDYRPGENPDNPYVHMRGGIFESRNDLFSGKPATERTDQGDQYVMPGGERSAVQAAAGRGEKATTSAKQKPMDMGMFAPKEAPQPSLFDKPAASATKINPNQKAADYVAEMGRKTGHEYAVAVDAKTGELVGQSTSGQPNSVTFTPDLIARMSDAAESLVLHHNHPAGTSLSPVDIGILMYPGTDSIIAHTHEGDVSIARLTPRMKESVAAIGPVATWNRLKLAVNQAWQGAFNAAQEAFNAGHATADELRGVVSEAAMRALHQEGVLEYSSSHMISHLTDDLQDQIIDRAAYAARNILEARNLASDVRGPPRPVFPEDGIAGLPGADGKIPEAAPARGGDGSSAGASGARGTGKGGQYSLLENGPGGAFREAPEVREVFDQAATAIKAGRGPLKKPVNLARTVGRTIEDSVLGRMVRRVVSPGSYDATATVAARGIRQVFGQMYVRDLQAAHALKGAVEELDKMTPAERTEFAIRVDEGGKQPTPVLQAIADNLRRQTTAATKRLQTLGVLEDAKENYLGRIWKPRGEDVDAATGDKVLARLTAKKPLTGGKSFLKQRYYDTYREAIDSGLEPQFANPITTQLVKISEMNRCYAGTLVARGAKQSGIAKFFRMGEDHGDMMELEGQEFQRPTRTIEHADGTTTSVPEGAWYAPEGFARVMNNHVSMGLKGTPFEEPAKYLRAVANTMNGFQLGLSFFHPVFTSLDAQASRMGIGLDQAMRGEFGAGAKNFIGGLSPSNWVTNMMEGDRFLKTLLAPENATPEQLRLIDAFGVGGGRAFMQRVLAPTDEGAIKFWKSGAIGTAIRDAGKKYPQSPFRATFNVLGRMLETTMAPVMEYVVPRQKLGVFSRLAEDWLQSHPDATNTEFVAAMQDRWESVDNRLGQMVYDNLFWNKTLKDIAFMTTRSVGWNLGSLREIGGGAADTGKFVLDAASGNKPAFTHRMSYVAGMVMLHTMYAAMLQYMFTGKGPQEPEDYFYPKTGLQRQDGSPDRLQIPTYMKDVFAYAHAPAQTALNKTSPLLSFISQLSSGKDYYGDLIANKDDPALEQFGDVMKFTAAQFMPFSFQSTKKLFQEYPGPVAALGMFGVTPAPGYIVNPRSEQKWLARQHKADVTKTRRHEVRKEHVAPLKPLQERAAGGRVQAAAALAHPEPSDAQKHAGNYRMGHLGIFGLDITIENAKDSIRRGVGADGKEWSVKMPAAYGYLKRTEGADGSHVDVYLGPDETSKRVFIVDQIDPESGRFDEHKCLLLFPNMHQALATYKRGFSDGSGEDRAANIRSMSIGEFKDWLRNGDTKKAIAA